LLVTNFVSSIYQEVSPRLETGMLGVDVEAYHITEEKGGGG
jgi:hypothetical protein